MKAPRALVLALLTVAGTAHADPTPNTVAAQRTVSTPDYTETATTGEQVVKFTGDELVGPAGGAYGDVIRRPPGVMKVGLIRPRMNFVAELLKSVEHL